MSPLVASKVVLQEVESMLQLVRAGESADEIRQLIGHGSPFRRAVRLHFDAVLNKHGGSVEAIPIASPAATRKCRPRRRFSPELKHRIASAVAARKTPQEIAREFQISHTAAARACRGQGSPYARKELSAEELAQAVEMLKSGRTWEQAAEHLGVGKSLLKSRLDFRKPANTRTSGEVIRRATQMLQDGKTWAEVARAVGVSLSGLKKNIRWRKFLKTRELNVAAKRPRLEERRSQSAY
jgi:transposase-like protein